MRGSGSRSPRARHITIPGRALPFSGALIVALAPEQAIRGRASKRPSFGVESRAERSLVACETRRKSARRRNAVLFCSLFSTAAEA